VQQISSKEKLPEYFEKEPMRISPVAVILTFLLTACPVTPISQELPVNSVILQDNVVVLTTSDRAAIASVQDDKVVFTSKVRFKPGDILINETGKPFLRRVIKIADVNEGYAMVTEKASLSDVIRRGKLDFSLPVKMTQLTGVTTAQLKAKDVEFKDGKLCLKNQKKNGFTINLCSGIELKMKFEANFDFFNPGNSKIKIYGELEGSVELEPKVTWKIQEKLLESIPFRFTSTQFIPEINTPFGKLKIPIEVGPGITLGFAISANKKPPTNAELSLSLFKLKLGLKGKVGVQSKDWGLVAIDENAQLNPFYEFIPVSFSGKAALEAKPTATFETKMKISYGVTVFESSNLEVAIEPTIESNLEIIPSQNSPIGFRIDHRPELKIWAGLRGAIDLSIWLFKVSSGADFGIEAQLAKLCGSIPPDGSITVDPTAANLQANETKILNAAVNGYPFVLTLDQSQCGSVPTWTSSGGILNSVSDGRSATFRAASGGTYAVKVINPLDTNKTATATISVAVGNIGISPPGPVSLTVGQSQQLTANETGLSTTAVSWTSSAPGVASVTSSGLVAALASGSTTITAQSTVDSSKTASVLVTVSAPTGAEISGSISGLPNGVWKVAVAYTPNGSSLYAVGARASVSNGLFQLPLDSPPTGPVTLVPISSPQTGVSASPSTTNWTVPLALKLLVFNDSNGDNQPSSNEQVAFLSDSDNTFRDNSSFGSGALNLVYADQAYSLTGQGLTSNNSVVNWGVSALAGWVRYTFATNGTQVSVGASNQFSNLSLSVGSIGTIQTASFSSPSSLQIGFIR
jgi:Bacterial Ig-like domain (group 2)